MVTDVLAGGWAKALGGDRKQFDMFFDKMLDGFAYHRIVVDKAGKPVDYVFLEVNRAFEKMMGIKREQIIGKKVTEVFPRIDETSVDLVDIYSRVALTGKPVQIEKRAEPSSKWYKVSAYCPQKGYFVTLLEDITENKKAEQDLWQAKNDWERTFDSVPDLIAILDNKHKIVRANKAMAERLGVTPKQAIGLNCYTCVHGVSAPPEFCPHTKTMKDGKEHVAEVHEPRLGGDFLVSTTPLLDEKGRTLGSVLVARNITERKKAEAALRKSEEEFSSLFANMIDGFAYCQMIFDDTGKPVDFVYLQINDAFEKITGLKRDVVVGKKVTEAIPGIKEANPELFEIYGRVASTGKREKFEVFFKPLSMWLSISVYCPRKGYFAATFEDITNRKQQEREIESLSKFPSENPNPIFRLDGNGAILYANAAGASLLTAWKNKVGERAPKNIIQVVADALISDERVELEETFGAKTFSFLFAPITSKGYVNIYATDTTERKKAEEAIKRQAELINLSPDAIIVRTLDGNISFWSTGAEKLYGWTKDEAIGQDINSLLKSEFPQPLEKILRKVKLSGKWSGEITHICKDGSKMFVQSFWLAKFGADGKITEMLESNVDITERIRIQTKLEESAVLLEEYANQMEELANKRAAQLKDAERLAAIGATAGMVGHDIRNPLQAITGDVYLAKTELASTFESEEKKNALESLTEIEKNVDYINKIVADLQDFARPLNPHAEETNLKLVINELLKKNGLPKNVKVNVKVEPEAGKIMADSSYINRIMYNLVTNAVQAMPKGGKLTIQAYKQENDSIITVADTGVGIPESIKGKLFTPMFTTKSKGQGFGLAVIKRMTEALGGTVTFESKVGKGTTFTIRLPSPKI